MLKQLVRSPINFSHGIQLSLYKPLGNQTCLNITRPSVLRQYFGRKLIPNNDQNNIIMCYTYGSGSGTSSAGMGFTILSHSE